MIDFVLGLYFASLVVRGWMRGLVREVMDLVGLLVGVVFGVRFSAAAGAFVEGWSGLGPGTSRILGGMVVFLGVGIASSVVARYLGRVMKLPGLNLSNRLGGSGLAFGWGWVLATIVISVAAVAPLPAEWQGRLAESELAGMLTNDRQPVQVAIRRFTGDRTLQSALNFDRLIGDDRVVLDPDETYEIEQAPDDEVFRDREAERTIFDLVNIARLDAGVQPLDWNDRLAEVAAGYARDMAVRGFFSHYSPEGESVADRVAEAGVPYRIVGENLALAVTVEIAHEGLMESEGHRENIEHPEFRSLGVGVADTPYGLVVVQVFHG